MKYFLIIIVSIAITTIGGYLLYTSPAKHEKRAPEFSLINTDGWKTFEHELFTYSYPEDIYPAPRNLGDDTVVLNPFDSEEYPSIVFTRHRNGYEISERLKAYRRNPGIDYAVIYPHVSNSIAYRSKDDSRSSHRGFVVETYFPREMYRMYAEPHPNQQSDLVTTIFSSFKHHSARGEQEAPDFSLVETRGWSTYADPDGHFSIRYPEQYTEVKDYLSEINTVQIHPTDTVKYPVITVKRKSERYKIVDRIEYMWGKKNIRYAVNFPHQENTIAFESQPDAKITDKGYGIEAYYLSETYSIYTEPHPNQYSDLITTIFSTFVYNKKTNNTK